ncbi:MAG: hypothetical protein CML17_02025 [Pusillimonas sp.]|nr:hypothetical protein [Pusillimonas sp.]|tara:strand:+ start:1500 stop:2516 length:1017 start_codon:yes stop_codon:yes gene_type:complete
MPLGSAKEQERIAQELMDKLEPGIRSAFLDMIDKIDIPLSELVALIEANDFVAVQQIINTQYGLYAPILSSAVIGAVVASGQSTAQQLDGTPIREDYQRISGPKKIVAVFDQSNPNTVADMEAYRATFISEITETQRDAIGNAVTDGLRRGLNPRDFAREIRQTIGLSSDLQRHLVNFRRKLEDLDPSVFSNTRRDKRFDATLRRAIEGDKPLSKDQINKMVERYRQRLLVYRSERIARTEALRAHSVGNIASWRQVFEANEIPEAVVRRDWRYTHDGRTREWHRDIPRLNPKGVGINEPFRTPLGPLRYPGDPAGRAANVVNCRCTETMRLDWDLEG